MHDGDSGFRLTVLCAAEFSLGSSSRSDVYCWAFGALAGAGGGEGYSSEVFTAFTDCSACALGKGGGAPITEAFAYCPCFKHDAASFTQRLRAERIAAAAVAGGSKVNGGPVRVRADVPGSPRRIMQRKFGVYADKAEMLVRERSRWDG